MIPLFPNLEEEGLMSSIWMFSSFSSFRKSRIRRFIFILILCERAVEGERCNNLLDCLLQYPTELDWLMLDNAWWCLVGKLEHFTTRSYSGLFVHSKNSSKIHYLSIYPAPPVLPDAE